MEWLLLSAVFVFALARPGLGIGCEYRGRDSVVTPTLYGSVSGCSIPTMSPFTPDKRINMWLGIPYAKRPIDYKSEFGEQWMERYRFKKPERPGNWKSPYDATHYRSACPQMLWYVRETIPNFSDTDEDCLYLNIFAPNFTMNPSSSTLYPVMIFIHGGGFTMGASQQWPAMMIAERNVVVVTINYRLGPLGFLSTGDDNSPGNYGLWDQLAAMDFIKKNVHYFKGNPEQVTLFGQSTGAASIGFHMLSRQTQVYSPDPKLSMFQKAIYMSGSDLNDWAVITEKWQMKEYAQELAQALGCATNSNSQMMRCLRLHRTASEIVNASAYIRVKDSRLGNPWAPVVDGAYMSSLHAYIQDKPKLMRRQGHFPHVRVMGGIVKDEGSWFIPNLPNLPVGIYKNEFENIVREFLEHQGSSKLNQALQALVFKYTYWPQPQNETMRRQMLIDLMSDYMFGTGIFNVLNAHASKNRTYAYMFDYKSYNDYLPTWRGIAHGQELQYVFGFPYFNETYTSLTGVYPRQRYTYGDNETAELMISLFTNFSVFDNPTYHPKKHYFGIKWAEYNLKNHTALVIRNQSASYMHLNYRYSYYAFWTHYFWPHLSGQGTKSSPKILKDDELGKAYKITTYCLAAVLILFIIILGIMCIRVCRCKKDDFDEWHSKSYHSNHHSSTTSI